MAFCRLYGYTCQSHLAVSMARTNQKPKKLTGLDRGAMPAWALKMQKHLWAKRLDFALVLPAWRECRVVCCAELEGKGYVEDSDGWNSGQAENLCFCQIYITC